MLRDLAAMLDPFDDGPKLLVRSAYLCHHVRYLPCSWRGGIPREGEMLVDFRRTPNQINTVRLTVSQNGKSKTSTHVGGPSVDGCNFIWPTCLKSLRSCFPLIQFALPGGVP
jgi:hypothetical protein